MIEFQSSVSATLTYIYITCSHLHVQPVSDRAVVRLRVEYRFLYLWG